jgi:hypothetical protein
VSSSQPDSKAEDSADYVRPQWIEGRPREFRVTFWIRKGPFARTNHTETFKLHWQPRVALDSLDRASNLYHQSGVYRLFLPGTEIGRLGGKDSTGTLYIGKAGTGSLLVSTVRTRLSRLLNNGTHRARDRLKFINQHFPEASLYVEWAYTGSRMNIETGEDEAAATVVENLLLNSYLHAFGELPPLNWR